MLTDAIGTAKVKADPVKRTPSDTKDVAGRPAKTPPSAPKDTKDKYVAPKQSERNVRRKPAPVRDAGDGDAELKPKRQFADDRREPLMGRKSAKVGAALVDKDEPKDTRNYIDAAHEDRTKLVFAHKGNTGSGAHGNSLKSISDAAKDGATDVVEIDFRELGDGTLVAYHDATFEDGPRKGELLRDVDLKELREDYPDVATVDEVAQEVARHDHLNVVADIKENGSEDRIVDGLLKHVPKERVSAFSFEPSVVKSLDEKYPDIPIGFLPRQHDDSFGKSLRTKLLGSPMEQVDRLGFTPDYIEVSGDNVNKQVLEHADEKGIPVVVGGTSEEEKVMLLDDDRVIGVMVNTPESVPALEEATYDPDEHGTLPDGPEYTSFHDSPLIPDALNPVIDKVIDKGFQMLSGDEGAAVTRGINLARDGYGLLNDLPGILPAGPLTIFNIKHDIENVQDFIKDPIGTVEDQVEDVTNFVDNGTDMVGDAGEAVFNGEDDIKYVPLL